MSCSLKSEGGLVIQPGRTFITYTPPEAVMPYEVEPQTPGEADHRAAKAPVEPKVKASAGGAGAGAALSAFLVWGADELWFNGDQLPPEVPAPVATLIVVVVSAASSFVAGYMARHVNR